MLRNREGRHFIPTHQVSQVSAVQKIARVMPIKPGTRLYRGLGGTVNLPDSFHHTDEHGCLGFAEWGFMSTTSEREVHTCLSSRSD